MMKSSGRLASLVLKKAKPLDVMVEVKKRSRGLPLLLLLESFQKVTPCFKKENLKVLFFYFRKNIN